MNRALALAAAAALYVIAAWMVAPGFYDGAPVPQYDYVSPPPELAPFNIKPTSGSGVLGPAGGFVGTKDQPEAQAGIKVPPHALSAETSIGLRPFAPPHNVPGIRLVGNAYCINSTPDMGGATVQVSLLIPPSEPFPSAMYEAPVLDGSWASIGGTVDLYTYLMTATTSGLGCFAVGYPNTTKSGPTIRGQLLPLIVAGLIAVVVLAGLPTLRRRRYNRP